MPEITAAMVKELRDKTDAGMMDCKKALTETGGDMEKAIEYLRKTGAAKAEKKSGRAVKEGLIAAHIDSKVGALVEVLCETDFVAKNEKFRDFIRELAKTAAEIQKEGDVTNDIRIKAGEKLTQMIAVIGENMQISRAIRWESRNGLCSAYLHMGGKIAVMIEAEGVTNPTILNDVCMHIAAFTPKYIVPEDIPSDIIAKEKEIAKSQLGNKPPQILEKILDGKISKWYSEVCLMKQPWIRDDKISTEKAVPGLKVRRFVRWHVGESVT
ncbi:MAG TPA: translation elongation factor Ts [Victivallales bacterium]|nr:translation elongation factor Ts [Victivallales bacterium]HPO90758.1 translation elongation factor Ts [Victivallales bacterium]HRR06122.1 translation elongation factor Ts [Victivallales bacterium]HRU01082.1 translation elongation factor Ts [Victivallales bacterium]